MQQIFLLIGDNPYQIALERRRWLSQFSQKHGGENALRLDAAGLKFPQLLDEVSALPFTASKRLVIVEGIALFEKDDVLKLPSLMHPDVILLFIDAAPDRRRSSVKALLEIADVRECPRLTGSALEQWIVAECGKRGNAIPIASVRALIREVGEDQLPLDQELRKLCLYAGTRPISDQDISLLTLPSADQNSWRILDLLADGDRDRVLEFTHTLLRHGETAAGVWSMLLWTVAQLTVVAAAMDAGARTPQAVMQKAGVKFGTARSLMPVASRIHRRALQAIVERFTQGDIDLKTGVLRSSAESPQEAEALLDVCIAQFASASRG